MADGKTALIVGASRGLGLGLAREFAGRGWAVVGTVRDDDGERALRKLRLETAPGNSGVDPVVRLDVTDEAAQDSLASRVQPGGLDLLFLNAGVMGPPDLMSASPEEADRVLQANAFGPARLAWRLLHCLKPRTGVIAFMTSGMGSIADNTSGGYEIYRASKAAQNQLARSLWVKSAQPRGVTVLSVNPGWVQTDMGGAGASIDVPTSVRGIADQVEAYSGRGEHAFVGWNGRILPW